jgi:D-alanyl-D-alanine carboxypeptidase/D-alanyl-D-alanine-endopeptidase (penicillin-binding protein 4)
LRRVGWKPTSVYEAWAKQLQQRGVTTVRDVVVDDAVFDEAFAHPDWPADQLDEYYEAQVGGVNFNCNVLDVQVGPNGQPVTTSPATGYVTLRPAFAPGSRRAFEVARDPGTNVIHLRGDPPARGGKVARTVHDPAMYAATVLSETLSAAGIKVTGTVRKDRAFRTRPADPAALAARRQSSSASTRRRSGRCSPGRTRTA